MVNKIRILFAILLLTGCSSNRVSSEPQKTQISVIQMEGLKLGEPVDQVLNTIGAPAEKIMNEGKPLWIYRDPKSGNQRAALGLDSDSKLLRYKTVLLSESDPESKLDYLLKQKFKSIHFTEIRFPQCGKDFVSDDALFVANSEGLAIQFSRSQKVASAISWSSSDQLQQDIKNIMGCKSL